jgi:hypothetical protein
METMTYSIIMAYALYILLHSLVMTSYFTWLEILTDLYIRDVKYLTKPEIIRLTPAFVNLLDSCRTDLSFLRLETGA